MLIAKHVPESIKAPIRRSRAFRTLYHRIHAERLARGSKRLDLCASQFAHFFHLAENVRLDGTTCLELGAGWLLTHALVCHLLGASKVVAIDVEYALRPGSLGRAVGSAPPAMVRDMLAPFAAHQDIRERLDRLRRIPRFDIETLASLGIEYRAPIDLARERLPERFDLIYSFSVLEHVPVQDVPILLSNLSAQLVAGGRMLHAIHLEDHRDIARDPFGFLAVDERGFDRSAQTERGNRMRASAWLRALGETKGLSHQVLWAWQRRDAALPERLEPAFQALEEDDLRTSHLGISAVSAREGAG